MYTYLAGSARLSAMGNLYNRVSPMPGLAYMFRRLRHALSIRVRARLSFFAPPEISVPILDAYRWDRYLLLALASTFSLEAERELQPLLERLLGWRRWVTCVSSIPHSGPLRAPVIVTQRPQPGTTCKQVVIAIDDFGDPPPGALVMPYFCHPWVYEKRIHERFPALRTLPKQQRVTFIGTAVPWAYPTLAGFPDLLPRAEVIEAAVAALPGQTTVLRSREALRGYSLGSSDLLLVLNECTEDNLDKHVLTLPGYLDIVARSWCFIAPPGCSMPFAHNLIEAMAVGSIPIVNYGHLLRPPLEDGRNCFAFQSAEDLADVLRRVTRAEERDLERMRQETLSYYRDVLSTQSFGTALREALRGNSDIVVLVNAEGESVRASLARRNGRTNLVS
jgi:hypothetical protein